MSERKQIDTALAEKGIRPGDEIEYTQADGQTIRGILMPHHEFSRDDILVVKLSSGYNIGIKVEDPDAVRKAPGSPDTRRSNIGFKGVREMKVSAPQNSGDTVSIISTGGTIASYVDYRTGAVHPAVSAEELASSVPELSKICNIETEMLYSILSENMKPENWTHISEAVAKHLGSGSRGVIVPHGTDTMGFTAAALSFSLSNLPGPVVLVGSQRSSDRPSSDASLNILSAARLCISSDLGEVVVLMHESTNDDACAIHRGTRVRKNHSSRRDAFESVNEAPLGRVSGIEITLRKNRDRRRDGEVTVESAFDDKVVLIHSYPGLSRENFSAYTEGAHGVVVAGTGLGHVSEEIIPGIADLSKRGIPVCMTTQCLWGSTNISVYSTGRDLLSAGAIPLGDMLPETAYVKLCWVLGQTGEMDRVRSLMVSNLKHEISDRRFLL